jgi:hypothetical protein
MFIIAGVLFAVAAGTWWFQHVAFSPSNDSDVTLSILGDEQIRGEIAPIIARADAPELSQSPTELKEFIEEIARIPAGAALMTDFVTSAHALLIGQADGPVLISAGEQVVIVRDERVGQMPPITLPVQEVSSLSTIDTGAGWLTLGSLGLGVAALLVGLILRPERGEAMFALGVSLATLAGLLVVLGYLIPLLALPALSESTWMGVFPRLANHSRNLTLAMAVAALAVGAFVTLSSGRRRERRQRSTPLSVGRDRGDRSWGR